MDATQTAMSALFLMTDSRKRVLLFTLLTFLAMC